MNLKGKNVLITGASDGIGASIAMALAKEGARLILCGRNKERLEKVAKKCGKDSKCFVFDLNDSKARNKAVTEIIKQTEIDVLINNAGVWHKAGDLNSLTEEKIVEVINTNLTSQILLTQKLLPTMIDRETAIINIVSKSGVVAQSGQIAYTASKFGLKGFTDVLREDTKAKPIRIGAVYQSGTDTDLFSKAGDNFPTDKFTNPDDLAQVIVFMLHQPAKIWLNEVHVTY